MPDKENISRRDRREKLKNSVNPVVSVREKIQYPETGIKHPVSNIWTPFAMR
jgi:hypothetical protein